MFSAAVLCTPAVGCASATVCSHSQISLFCQADNKISSFFSLVLFPAEFIRSSFGVSNEMRLLFFVLLFYGLIGSCLGLVYGKFKNRNKI